MVYQGRRESPFLGLLASLDRPDLPDRRDRQANVVCLDWTARTG
jgi:hypothetical protein